jgi:hypothetical protein
MKHRDNPEVAKRMAKGKKPPPDVRHQLVKERRHKRRQRRPKP